MYNETPPPSLFRREEMIRTLKMQKKSLNCADETCSVEKGKGRTCQF